MRERFEKRRLTGIVNVACKYDDGSVRNWSERKEVIIKNIVSIVQSYSAKGYTLTLRQLHYQLVSRNWIINHDTAYKKLGSILDDCRYSGLIDWDAIEDRGRVPHLLYHVGSVKEALEDTHKYYRLDRQDGQSNHVELWTEKDALSGILKRTTEKYHTYLVVNKGYTSSSAIYRAYERIAEKICSGKQATILYFGDHDPSGLDMVRDINDRLIFFLTRGEKLSDMEERVELWMKENSYSNSDVIEKGYCSERVWKLTDNKIKDNVRDELFEEFVAGRMKWFLEANKIFNVLPIGLTMQQIKKYKLPPNPTKLTDTRSDKYVKQFGKTCWEVDALDPEILTSIVEENIQSQIDLNTFYEVCSREQKDKKKLNKFISNAADR